MYLLLCEAWNDDPDWVHEDEILIQIVERRRKQNEYTYDDIVMKWKEEEWTSICKELRRTSKSKKRRPWKDVKNRFKKVIVPSKLSLMFHKMYSLTIKLEASTSHRRYLT